MEGSEQVILEISSDEENWSDTGGGCNTRANFDSDVTMIEPNSKRSVNKMVVVDDKDDDKDDDDDDCVILDGDPDKPVSADDDAIGDSDDLVVVGSKGQVACRDFPHPRHLCANYEFATTPHEKYCSQCHCYVCDELSPCVNWGDGTCILDHCHATDKIEYWKLERQLLKGEKTEVAVPPPQALPRLTAVYSIRPCSTTTGNYVAEINPNQSSNSQHLPSSQNKNTHQNISIHQVNGARTAFKRTGEAILTTNGTPRQLISQIFHRKTNFQALRKSGNLSSTPYEYVRLTTLLDSVDVGSVNPLPFQSNSICLPESSQSFDHSHSHPNVGEATNLPQQNSSASLQNPLQSQSQISSQHKGDNSVSHSLPNSCESNSNVDSTLRIRDANLQRNQQTGSDLPQLNSSTILQNPLPSQSQTFSQHKGDNSISNSLPYSQPAPNLYEDSTLQIRDANPEISGSKVPNFDSNWRSNCSDQTDQQTGFDLPQTNSSAFLQNPLPSQPQTSSQHKGDNSVSHSLPNSQSAATCESNSNVDSTLRIQDANLQTNGLKVPHFDSNWRSSNNNQRNQQTGSDLPQPNSSAFLQNPLPSSQTSSQHKGDNSVSNSLSHSQPAAECEPYRGSPFIRDANLQMNGSKIPNFDSNWRSSNINQRNQQTTSDLPQLNSSSFLQNPWPSHPQASFQHIGDSSVSNSIWYSQSAAGCESNSNVDSTFRARNANLHINGLKVPHFDYNWRPNNSNQRNQQTGSDFPQPNSSAFLQNPLPSQSLTSSQLQGDNPLSNSLLYSQPAANSYVHPTSRFRDANVQINGLNVPNFDSNWRSNNSHQRNQQGGSGTSRQVIYDPRFPSETNLGSLGFDHEPWMLDESLCPMSPGLDVYPGLYF
ncbi:homeobox protein 5-like [Impatiens glandulifera]|uniref:homeobox protein 5-like n=1 Tax=Impatiens glandulifera TaxID=253017 RepID=UPI001FB0B395|nr:homeobox protein 5-like [Impatiens glandulifera]